MHENENWKWSRSVVSDSQLSHGLQPTRLLRPWDFPGKSTGVGCHCLLLQLLSHVQLFATPWTAVRQASLSIINSRSVLKLMSIQLVMPSNHLILCCPLLLLPQSLPASESFPMSQFFTLGGQGIGVSASASVLPMIIQDWFPLWLTGLSSSESSGFSRVFSNTTVQKHQFFGTQLYLWYNSHIHT